MFSQVTVNSHAPPPLSIVPWRDLGALLPREGLSDVIGEVIEPLLSISELGKGSNMLQKKQELCEWATPSWFLNIAVALPWLL